MSHILGTRYGHTLVLLIDFAVDNDTGFCTINTHDIGLNNNIRRK